MNAHAPADPHADSAIPLDGPSQRPAGTLVLIGGALDEHAGILSRIVALADARRGSGAPRIAILTTASEPAPSAAASADPSLENDAADGQYYVELFTRHGATGLPIPVGASSAPPYAGAAYHAGRASDPEVAELVRSADAVFLGGGDQSHYVRALFTHDPAGAATRTETPVLTAIREVLDRGGVIAGTSAGLAVQQGAFMVTGGADIHTAWAHGAAPGTDREIDGREALSYDPVGGLGLFTEALLDSHFSEWGRPARAVRLARDTAQRRCIGVDEHTAFVYDRATRVAEVLGDRGVSFLDLDGAEGRGDSVLGTRWSYLVPGDRHDFATDVTVRGTQPAGLGLDPDPDLDPAGAAPSAAGDIWADDGSRPLLALAQRLLASPDSTARGESAEDRTPRYRTSLHRDERTIAFPTGGFAELILSITPTHPTH
ncbi:cyanophycinase [Leucobacter chromiireducens]|uniref:cyanophycinase n=1 Tax=Leucobacter chromiireducens TaxID=283877 RepID=UPI000F635C1C|nr:cyanophycinase [Leucobacter chromiireducens]